MKTDVLKKTVYLCGFMGSGKSTVGLLLSRRLSLPRVDTDFIISRKNGMKITEIFEQKGEAYFRDSETKLLKKLSYQRPKIVSLGGGTVGNAKNVEIMKKRGYIVFLNTPFPLVYERVRRNNKRPLANSKTEEELLKLYDERMEVYRRASDIELRCISSAPNVVGELYELLKKKGIIEER